MNKKLVYAVVGLMLSVSSFAQGASLTGKSREASVYSDCDSGVPLNLHGIDFDKGIASADQDAKSKCSGQIKRVSAYQVAPSCVVSRVWNYRYLFVSFSAIYECF